MFARTTAPKVLSRADQNFRLVVRLAVEDEVGVLARIWVFAEGEEESVGEASPLKRLQELFWDDHVRVDVLDVQGRGDTLEDGELLDAGRCL